MTREGHLKHLVNTLAVTALLASTASAQGTAVRAAAAPTYEPGIDVQDYAFTLELPDTGSFLRGDATVTLRRSTGVNTLRLDLVDALIVRRVIVNDSMVPVMHVNGRIDIPLPATGDSVRVRVVYDGIVSDGLIVRKDAAGRWTWYGDNWPNRTREWLPTVDHPSDKATVTWRVRAPVGRTVVANGKLVAQRQIHDATGGSRVEWEWRESRPISVYLMVIAAAPLEVFDLGDTACGLADKQRCVPQQVYTAPEQHASMPGAFARAPEIVQFYARMFGTFPYEKLAHLQSSTRFGGMENASDIFYSDRAFRRGTMTDGLIAHETAHQWFGDAVTERDWAHLWLSEGFATYLAALWTRAARGDSAFHADMSRIRATVLADTIAVTKRPVIDTIERDYMSLLNRNSYEKGGFVLQMLRAQVGERAFFDALRAYYAAHRNSTAFTDDLRAAMEHESKQNLGWFFDQWLRRPGYPELTVKWAYDAAAHEVVLDMSQSTRFGVFQFPVTVAVVDSAGTTHRDTLQMPATAGAHQLRIPLGTAPAHVIVDPDIELLAAMTVIAP